MNFFSEKFGSLKSVLTFDDIKQTKTEKMKFEIGKTYKGVSGVGECAITVVKRTDKSIWIDSSMEKNKRLKIKSGWNNTEAVSYRSWWADASEIYTEEKQVEDAYYAAYNR